MKLGSRLGVLTCALLLGLVECGGSDEANRPNGTAGSGGKAGDGSGGRAGSSGSAGKGRQEDPVNVAGASEPAEDACLNPSVDDYEPVWMPPRAVPGACTSEQISQAYSLCEGGSLEYDAEACRAFNTSKTNAGCLSCMFSAVGDEHSGAIVVFPGSHWIANTGGCIALLDGATSDASCGARTQADSFCPYSLCVAVCTSKSTNAEWDACDEAAEVACTKYSNSAACRNLPQNARCRYQSFKEYFLGLGDMFCGSGPDGGEGGAAGADGGGGAAGSG